ncbi:MAG TPA: hypothetical protein VEZ71_15100, partial [Archangium sp.]|nr:hypothetical protein [Archangium sp.]
LRIASVGTGEALGARTLGAWTSAVLLGATALGLALTGLGARRPPPQVPTAPSAATLFTAAALALAFSLLGVFAALSSGNLSEALQATGQLNPADTLAVVLAVTADRLLFLQRATTGALTAMVLLFVALSVSRLSHSKRQGAIPGLVVLAALLVLVPLLDGLPLRDAVQLARSLLPQESGRWAGVEPLTLPDSTTPQKPIGAVTPEGFISAGGTRTPWSAGEEALARALESGQGEDTEGGSAPNKFLRALAKKKGTRTGQGTRTFALIVDARLDGAQVRTLVEASLRAKASRLQLIGQGIAQPAPEAERVLESAHPLLPLVLRRTGAVNVELSRGAPDREEAQAARYTARLEGAEALRISPLEAPDSSRLVPLVPLPTNPPEGLGMQARVYLGLDEHASVRAIAAAASALGLAEAQLVLSPGETASAPLEVVEDGSP